MNTKQMAAASLLISTFVAGGVSGFAVSRVLDDSPTTPRIRDGRPGFRPGGMGPPAGPVGLWPDSIGRFRGFAPMMLSHRLVERLGLSENQLDQIRAIMEARRAASSEILEELGPRLRIALDSMELEIREVLSEEQQARFDEFVAEDRDLFLRRKEELRQGRRFP